MAKHLSKHEVGKIVNLILNWRGGKLTWNAICEAARPAVGKVPTRQSLTAHHEIAEAYKAAKADLKGGRRKMPHPSSLEAAANHIANLERQMKEQLEVIRRYKQQFTVWSYNAFTHGVNEQLLNTPLPEINRERSDGATR